MRPASLVAAVVLAVVAIAHVLRLVLHTEVIIGGTVMPMWISGLGAVVAGILSTLVYRETRSSTR